jgi:predicted glycoside hydrolase/deacetylase ChbG (UPF0249 family)
MTTRKKQVLRQVPRFSSREEEARFWDTHDISDYWDGMKPVRVRFAKQLSQGITVRFDPKTLTQLRLAANKRGIGPTTLVRMWVLEHLEGEKTPGRPKRAKKAG